VLRGLDQDLEDRLAGAGQAQAAVLERPCQRGGSRGGASK